MYKRLLKDASLYSVSSLLARGFSFITVPIYTRLLNPADYGALDLLSYTAVLVPLLVGMALDQAVARFYLDAKDETEKKRIASTALLYTVLIYAIFIPLVGPLSENLAEGWLDHQVGKETVILVFILMWVHSIFYIANNQLKYLFMSRQYAFCNIGNTVLSISLGLLFIVQFGLGVAGIFLGQIIGQAVFGALSLYYARNSYSLTFHWQSFRRMLKYSTPLVPGTLAFFLMQYVDRYYINEYKGLGDVGLYGIGARIASLINLFLMGFQGAWSPIVMKAFREPGSPVRFERVFNYYLFVVAMVLVWLSLFGKEILLLLTTEAFSERYVVVPTLVLAAILASVGGYFTYGIQIAEKSGRRLVINLIALVINVGLNIVLIPLLGIIGAALATTISFAFLAFASMVLSQKYYYVPYKWGNIFWVGLFTLVISNSVTIIDFEVSMFMLSAKFVVGMASVYIVSRILKISMDMSLFRTIKAPDRSGNSGDS